MARLPKPPGLKALTNARPSGYDRGITPIDIRPECPVCPDYLNGDGRNMWDYLVPKLDKARMLTMVDLFALIALEIKDSDILYSFRLYPYVYLQITAIIRNVL